MDTVVNIYKPIGKTPLEVVNQYKENYPEYRNKRIGYAGRLDPMAHGVLLLLIEPETKKRNAYQGLDKSYTFELILGIETDTHDVMGVIKSLTVKKTPDNIQDQLRSMLSDLPGTHEQPYPIYSSKTVQGKPLYWWARNGLINKIRIPHKRVRIHYAKIVKIREISARKLSRQAVQRIALTSGDFRQEKIVQQWQQFALKNKDSLLHQVQITLSCSSGTYVRGIAKYIGDNLKAGAICADILRTRVGDYDMGNSMRLSFS